MGWHIILYGCLEGLCICTFELLTWYTLISSQVVSFFGGGNVWHNNDHVVTRARSDTDRRPRPFHKRLLEITSLCMSWYSLVAGMCKGGHFLSGFPLPGLWHCGSPRDHDGVHDTLFEFVAYPSFGITALLAKPHGCFRACSILLDTQSLKGITRIRAGHSHVSAMVRLAQWLRAFGVVCAHCNAYSL